MKMKTEGKSDISGRPKKCLLTLEASSSCRKDCARAPRMRIRIIDCCDTSNVFHDGCRVTASLHNWEFGRVAIPVQGYTELVAWTVRSRRRSWNDAIPPRAKKLGCICWTRQNWSDDEWVMVKVQDSECDWNLDSGMPVGLNQVCLHKSTLNHKSTMSVNQNQNSSLIKLLFLVGKSSPNLTSNRLMNRVRSPWFDRHYFLKCHLKSTAPEIRELVGVLFMARWTPIERCIILVKMFHRIRAFKLAEKEYTTSAKKCWKERKEERTYFDSWHRGITQPYISASISSLR